jgi:uncharacterized membrane protein
MSRTAEITMWSGILVLLSSAYLMTVTSWFLVTFFLGVLLLFLGLKRMFRD